MRKFWTTQEIETLRRLYPDCKTITLELIFKRKASIISQKASTIGIHKSEGYRNSPLSGRISKTNDIGLGTRFTNLSPGWNKGLKQKDYMSPEMIERTARTRFKKGQNPHNTVAIGHERISRDGYLEVKINHFKTNGKNDNFEAKHRILYVEHFGPIPKGMNVEFLDGNKMNLELSNLVLRTRKENLLKNTMCDSSIVKRFMRVRNPESVAIIITEMPELIEQKRKTILLNQKINKEYANDTKPVN